jgi:prevent-host-death family protein
MYKKAKLPRTRPQSKIKSSVRSTAQMRADLAETINRVAYGGERVILRRHGKPLAAMIPMQDLRLLEQLEERMDIDAARVALAETGRIPWDKFKASRRF